MNWGIFSSFWEKNIIIKKKHSNIEEKIYKYRKSTTIEKNTTIWRKITKNKRVLKCTKLKTKTLIHIKCVGSGFKYIILVILHTNPTYKLVKILKSHKLWENNTSIPSDIPKWCILFVNPKQPNHKPRSINLIEKAINRILNHEMQTN